MVEQLFDERVLGFFAGGEELGQVFFAFEFFDFAGLGQVAAGGVDRFVLVGFAIAADGVEVFHREAERVNHSMAALARFRLRLQGNAFAVAQIGVNIGRQRGDGLRGRSQHAAQHVARKENAAVDRRARVRVGKAGQQVRMGEDAGAMVGIEIDFLERGVLRELCAVQFCQAAVEVHVVGQQELAEVGRAAVENVVEREFDARCGGRR